MSWRAVGRNLVAVVCVLAVLPGQLSSQNLAGRVAPVIDMARQAAHANRHSEAIGLYKRALREKPAGRREWLQELADQLVYGGSPGEAIPLYREVLGKFKPPEARALDARLGLALALGRTGQYEASFRVYAALLRRYPANTRIRNERTQRVVDRAREAGFANNHTEAIRWFRQAIKLDASRRPELSIELASQLTYAGRPKEAVVLFRQALRRRLNATEIREARFGLGLALGRSGNLAASLKVYDGLLRNDPKDEKARNERTQRLVDAARQASWANRHAESVALFERAVRQKPSLRGEVLLDWAGQLTYGGRPAEGAELFEQWLKIPAVRGPGYAREERRALLGLATALSWSGRYAEALAVQRRVPDEGDPEARQARIQRTIEAARKAAWTDRNAESLAYFESVLAEAPEKRAEVLLDYADQLTFGSTRAQEAIPLFREALAKGLSPKDRKRANLGLALALARAGKTSESLHLANELAADYPADPVVLRERVNRALDAAHAAARADRNQEALGLLERARSLAPDRSDEWRFEFADQLTFSGRAKEAIALYQAGLASNLSADRKRAKAGLSLALSRSGEMAEALCLAEELAAEYPADAAVQRERVNRTLDAARAAAHADQNHDALALFERANALDPGRSGEWRLEYADQLTFTTNPILAIPIYEQELEAGKIPVAAQHRARLALGLALGNIGRLEQSLRQYDLVLAEKGDDPAIRREKQRRLVAQARADAGLRHNADAARLFARALATGPDRPALWRAELAEQMTYSDQARQAIPVFRALWEERASLNADEQRKVGLGLALALSWTNELRQSQAVYEAYLKDHPGDADALSGRARVLSWRDKLGPALEAYNAALESDPKHMEAARDVARVMSWQGRQRKAVRRLAPFLARHPTDPEANLILAQSRRFAGRSDQAREVVRSVLVRDPLDKRAAELGRALEFALHPATLVEQQGSTQSDGLRITRFNVEQTVQFRDGLTTVGAAYQSHEYRAEKGSGVSVSRPGAFVRHRFGDTAEVNAYVFGDRVRSAAGRRTMPTFDVWMTVAPSDYVRLDVGASRVTFDNIRSLERGITATMANFSVDVKPTERTTVSTRFNRGWFSDGNARNWGQLDIQRRVHSHPSLFLGGRFTSFAFSRELDNGYFNPRSYQSGVMTGHLYGRAGRRLEYDLDAGLGLERAAPGGTKPLTQLGGRLRYRLHSHLELDLRLDSFSSRQASSSGFSRRTASVSLRGVW